MDAEIAELILRLIGSGFALNAAFWLTMAFWKPRWFIRRRFEGAYGIKTNGFSNQLPKSEWFFLIALVAGLGILTYCAAYGLVWWMPHEWGGIDEEGDFRSMRTTTQGFAAFAATYGILSAMTKYIDPIRKQMIEERWEEVRLR